MEVKTYLQVNWKKSVVVDVWGCKFPHATFLIDVYQLNKYLSFMATIVIWWNIASRAMDRYPSN